MRRNRYGRGWSRFFALQRLHSQVVGDEFRWQQNTCRSLYRRYMNQNMERGPHDVDPMIESEKQRYRAWVERLSTNDYGEVIIGGIGDDILEVVEEMGGFVHAYFEARGVSMNYYDYVEMEMFQNDHFDDDMWTGLGDNVN